MRLVMTGGRMQPNLQGREITTTFFSQKESQTTATHEQLKR